MSLQFRDLWAAWKASIKRCWLQIRVRKSSLGDRFFLEGFSPWLKITSFFPPVSPKPTEIGLGSDADFWGSLILILGTGGSRALTGLEHLEFLASAREGAFKMLVELWNSGLWWLVGAAGVLWFFRRFQKRKEPHPTGPTWGLVAACVVISAIFASLFTVQFSGAVPKIVTAISYNAMTTPGSITLAGCSAVIEGAQLLSFKKDYKVALVCAPLDPSVDELDDRENHC